MAAFPAMTKVRLRTSVLAPDPDPGSQKKVTGRAPSAGACLSHNDVHLGLWSFFFGPINCIPRNLSLGHNAMDKNRSSGPVRPSNAHTLRVSSRFPTPHFTLFFFPLSSSFDLPFLSAYTCQFGESQTLFSGS